MPILTRTVLCERPITWTAPDGTVRTDTEAYPVQVPRDWRRGGLAAATTGTAVLLAVAVAWSTASIGDLLVGAANPVIAYGAAVAFDSAWIICMILEWLARDDPDKARAPRTFGWVALVVAMAAVCVHGWLSAAEHAFATGIIGAGVSAIAKTVWSLVIAHTAKPLSPMAQAWVRERRESADAELLDARLDVELLRSRARAAAYRAAYTAAPAIEPVPDPDRPSGQPAPVSPTVRSAVRAALEVSPGAWPEDIVEQLARIGIETDADTVRLLSGQHPDSQDSSSGDVLALVPHRPDDTITDTVRAAVRTHGDNVDAVLSAVRRVHGPDVKRDTVRRLVDRVAS
ncbi:hypothetical protein [Kitasatospora sp. NPDC056184]|uniref:hypothetical protein n=1 Tax=Kitasatospora sp. NPDC056184 TaxID=3345738 RepID=UPI0035DF0412